MALTRVTIYCSVLIHQRMRAVDCGAPRTMEHMLIGSFLRATAPSNMWVLMIAVACTYGRRPI